MKTVRDMYRAGGMNDEYGHGGMHEYAKSGKMPPQLLEYFKKKGKEAQKKYQDSGYNPGILQRAYDEASQIGMGLLEMMKGRDGYVTDDFMRGYAAEEASDAARSQSGQAGGIDATGEAVGAFFKELTKPGMEYKPASVQKHPIDKAIRAFDRARMTSEERDALLREQRARMNR
tara:strand:+ start:240 stop:761 length:522 start_codon:yes stop_codon:yes gene_type:complete